jgi:hypothetical protein
MFKHMPKHVVCCDVQELYKSIFFKMSVEGLVARKTFEWGTARSWTTAWQKGENNRIITIY